jgi:hypothetical protein
MAPGHNHLDEGIIYQPFLLQQGQNIGPKKLCKRPYVNLGHNIKISAFGEQTIRYQAVKMWMPTSVVTEGLYGEDETGNPVLLAHGHRQKLGQAFGRALAQLPQQLTIIEEKFTKDFWYAEDILPIGNRIKHRLFQVMGKLDHLFAMAGRTEPATSAAVSKQVFVVAIRTSYTSESVLQVTALKVFMYHMGYDWTVKTVLTGEDFVVAQLKLFEMMAQNCHRGESFGSLG